MLEAVYCCASEAAIRQQSQTLRVLPGGEWRSGDVAAAVGVNYRTVQRRVTSYRRGNCGSAAASLRGPGQSPRFTPKEMSEKRDAMRWIRPGAQAVATPRALHRSSGWAAIWQTQPHRRRRPASTSREITTAAA